MLPERMAQPPSYIFTRTILFFLPVGPHKKQGWHTSWNKWRVPQPTTLAKEAALSEVYNESKKVRCLKICSPNDGSAV